MGRSLEPHVGDVVTRNDVKYVVCAVQPNYTPYRHAGQDTTVESYTLGLERVAAEKTP